MPESAAEIGIFGRAAQGGIRNEWLDDLPGTQAIKEPRNGFNIEDK
jgi:hypothetical protein